MWESYGLENEDFLWTCIPFMGGISGQQEAPCGAVSASAVCLALRHRCSLEKRDEAKQARTLIRRDSAEIVRNFNKKFGTIICRDLLSIDFSKPGEYARFHQTAAWKGRCDEFVQFIIEELYRVEDGAGADC